MTIASPSPVSQARYSVLARTLHWLIAALILIQIGLGWYLNEVLPDHSPAQDQAQDIHVTLGLTILILVLARIAVRLTHRPPPLPAGMATWERALSQIVHVLFYILMLAMPLSGWALVSARHEDIPFWGLQFPPMPGLSGFHDAAHRPFNAALKHLHVYVLIWIVLVNLALHVAGALKHQFDGHPVLWRMLPWGGHKDRAG